MSGLEAVGSWVCHAVASPGVKCTLVAVRRDDPDAVATYAGPVNRVPWSYCHVEVISDYLHGILNN